MDGITSPRQLIRRQFGCKLSSPAPTSPRTHTLPFSPLPTVCFISFNLCILSVAEEKKKQKKKKKKRRQKRRCNANLKPVLNWANVCSPNILRTLRRTMIRFLIELLVRRIWFGQSKLYFVLNWLVMRAKNLATPSSIFIFIFPSSTGELCSQPIRGNDRRIGQMFPEHVERSLLDPEYSFDEYFQLGSRRKVRPIKNQLASPNTSN